MTKRNIKISPKVIRWLKEMGKTETDFKSLKPHNQNLLSELIQGRDPMRSDAQLRDLFSDLGVTACRGENQSDSLTSDDRMKLFPKQDYLNRF